MSRARRAVNNEVYSEAEQEGKDVHAEGSEHQEHITSEEHEAHHHERHENEQELLEVGFLRVFIISCIRSACCLVSVWALPILPKYVVPSKIEGEQSWKQTKPHDEASVLAAEQSVTLESSGICSKIIVVFVPFWCRSLRVWSIWDVFSLLGLLALFPGVL